MEELVNQKSVFEEIPTEKIYSEKVQIKVSYFVNSRGFRNLLLNYL